MGHAKGGFEWIRSHYPVPARQGQRVIVDGKPARITSVMGGHLVLHMDGEPKRRRRYTHPCWEIDYLDRNGQVEASFHD